MTHFLVSWTAVGQLFCLYRSTQNGWRFEIGSSWFVIWSHLTFSCNKILLGVSSWSWFCPISSSPISFRFCCTCPVLQATAQRGRLVLMHSVFSGWDMKMYWLRLPCHHHCCLRCRWPCCYCPHCRCPCSLCCSTLSWICLRCCCPCCPRCFVLLVVDLFVNIYDKFGCWASWKVLWR